MVIAALLTFATLLAAWLVAPTERRTHSANRPRGVLLPTTAETTGMAELPEAA